MALERSDTGGHQVTTPSTPSPGAGELLPCPFCGSEAEQAVSTNGGRRPFYASCPNDCACFDGDTQAEADARWNRRTPAAPSAPLAGEGETLPVGTLLHFNGCPLRLAQDCRVISATRLAKWQDETLGRDSKEPADEC